MTDIERKVTEIIAEQLALDPDEVTSTATLEEDLSADSLDVVEIVLAAEADFNIRIADEDSDAWKTPADIVATVERLAKEK